MNSFRAIGVLALTILVGWASAQTPPGAAASAVRRQAAGTVAAVDAQAGRITLKTDRGESATVTTTEGTLFVRIPPGETDVRKGSKISISGLEPGDRIVAIGQETEDRTTVAARSVLVMTKADVAQVQTKAREEWLKRGAGGTAAAVDAAGGTLTLKAGQKTLTVKVSEKTEYRRYAPDSARFTDALPATLPEIKPGDQVRVLGDRNESGDAIEAEKVIFGTFRQLAATITSINAGAGEIVVKDLASKKPITIRVNSETAMKKLPEMMARMLARRYQSGGAQGEAQNGPGGPGRAGMRGGNGDIGQMLDRLPSMPLGELKPGDAIMVSTTAGSDPARLTATTLLAGVEPLLTASPAAARDIMSGWNLGGGSGAETETQ